VAGSYEDGNKPSGSINGEEFLQQLSNYEYLRRTMVFLLSFPVWIPDQNAVVSHF